MYTKTELQGRPGIHYTPFSVPESVQISIGVEGQEVEVEV